MQRLSIGKSLTSFLLKQSLFLAAVAAIALFCERQTHGFRFDEVLGTPISKAPPEKTPSPAIQRLLSQPFTFLGRGGFCYAFLGEDGQTVLKLFRHDHLYLEQRLLKNLALPSFLDSGRRAILAYRSRPLANTFQSCQLAYEELKQETGLIYLHLHQTDHLQQVATLIDPLGIAHRLNLDSTEFLLQKRAKLAFAAISAKMEKGEVEEAKKMISKLLQCLLNCSQRGIRDLDSSFKKNYGFAGEEAMILDVGSFKKDPTLQYPALGKKELICKTRRLNRWLQRHYPELCAYYDEQIKELLR